MSVRVSLLERDRIVSLTRSGLATRVQTSAANEKVRELVISSGARGVLVDMRDIEVITSARHCVEILEDFIYTLERPLPIGFLAPRQWSKEHHEAAWALSRQIENRVGVFKTPELALEWLRSESRSPAQGLRAQPSSRKSTPNSLRLSRINHTKTKT